MSVLKRPDSINWDSFLVAFGIYGGVGVQLALAVVGGLLLGNYLDKKLNLAPWLTLSGLVLGSGLGFYQLIRLVRWYQVRRQNSPKT